MICHNSNVHTLNCEGKYTGNPDRYFYGKKALGFLKSKIQWVLYNPLKFLLGCRKLLNPNFKAFGKLIIKTDTLTKTQ